ncbi:hypothetical protein ABZW10_38165 [Kitasatospora sp. NPDC004723]|uniref:hypothetical protein n=1 Tax=Kitasatospora sp. NPDC004723 TaxID=3154288 RepID=UPI0033B42628
MADRTVDTKGGAPVDGEQSLDGGQQHAGGVVQGGARPPGPGPLGCVLILGGQQRQRLVTELFVGPSSAVMASARWWLPQVVCWLSSDR